jgi:hypothetical protein
MFEDRYEEWRSDPDAERGSNTHRKLIITQAARHKMR